ncbi:apolipoprotein N-acyltransferase [Actinokineospora baliensis]|uniref:hypothetical protein n=1 Tax=Actinokineospora baliensis TaxID=547056 RepID=UPI001956E99D|nr:hypothetical protein [Actinokineospora baliensis]MBM7773954.1 apolipoprotein N-acyltransferase [Actinokineospora baliensis]
MTVETRPDQRPSLLPLLWVLLFFTWLFAVPALALESALSGWSFMGSPSAAALAKSDRLAMWAEILAVAVPLVGVVLALITRRNAPMRVFGTILFLSVVVIGCVWVAESRHNPAPAPTPVYRGCQEHSGGDNRCPGG